jgi:hypothetical protein
MRTFRCACGRRVFFVNTVCLHCQRELAFLPDRSLVAAIEPGGNGFFATPHGRYRKCANNVDHGVCNWMIPEADAQTLCQACRLNQVIPDLSNPENRALWGEVEKAKRRLVYSLNQLRLPITSKAEDPEKGLAFDIKADEGATRVLTGHAEGLITLNLAEADAVTREQARVSMNERYRTLLGHFRHEIGHYYWERLVRDGDRLPAFRDRFGDERADYGEALKRHYAAGTQASWPDHFISAYAASHPWEDWAETFAHYLHMIDTLETAQSFGFTSELPPRADVAGAVEFDVLMAEWLELTVALNALNRSMGLEDAYPFAISDAVRAKLAFVHAVVKGTSDG